LIVKALFTGRNKKENVLEIYQNKRNKSMTQSEMQSLINSSSDSTGETSPLLFSLFLRTTIITNRDYLEIPLIPHYEMKLLSYVEDFVNSYHSLMCINATQFPFPIVQMCQTLLWLWVLTLPFALRDDYTSPDKIVQNIVLIILLTYGFIGLEMVSIELDEPFGDDLNDFDIKYLTQKTINDIIIYLKAACEDNDVGLNFRGKLDTLEKSTQLTNLFEVLPLRRQQKSWHNV